MIDYHGFAASMNGIDVAILAAILVSALFGIWRGFTRELLSLVIWISAFALSYAWAGTLEAFFIDLVADRSLRLVACFVLIFLSVHVIGFIVARLLKKVIKSVGLASVDRIAGAGFGVMRGVAIVMALIVVVGLTPFAQESMWQQSYMVTVLQQGLDWIQEYYPFDDSVNQLTSL